MEELFKCIRKEVVVQVVMVNAEEKGSGGGSDLAGDERKW